MSFQKTKWMRKLARHSIPRVFGDGRAVVTTAGTRVQLPDQECTRVHITAETDNTEVVVVGGSTVVASLSTRRGTPLYATDDFTIYVANLNQIWIDSTVNGEGITYSYENADDISES